MKQTVCTAALSWDLVSVLAVIYADEYRLGAKIMIKHGPLTNHLVLYLKKARALCGEGRGGSSESAKNFSCWNILLLVW